jgi:hypothetical protein
MHNIEQRLENIGTFSNLCLIRKMDILINYFSNNFSLKLRQSNFLITFEVNRCRTA